MIVAPDYFLRSARLGFRCWSRDDLPLALALWGDQRVTQFIGGPFSPEQIEHRLKKENDSLQEHHFQYWPVFLLSDGQHVGCAGIRPYRPEEEIHELGFHLRPEFWGQGLAEEAARAVMAYAFETLNAKALSAGHHPANASSRHILEKLGFHFTHEEFYAPCGLQIPYYLLASPSISPP